MSVYEIFITVCKIAGTIAMLPVILGCILVLMCWGCCLMSWLVVIPFWILDKLTPGVRSERISSRRKPEEPPPVYSNKNLSKEMEECRISPKEDG